MWKRRENNKKTLKSIEKINWKNKRKITSKYYQRKHSPQINHISFKQRKGRSLKQICEFSKILRLVELRT